MLMVLDLLAWNTSNQNDDNSKKLELRTHLTKRGMTRYIASVGWDITGKLYQNKNI